MEQKISELISPKNGKIFNLNSGINDELILQLIQKSNDLNDSGIQDFTSDQKRFADLVSFNKWRRKERVIYTLTTPGTNSLVGIMWLGKEQIPLKEYPEYGITLAIRLYNDARGVGLGPIFMEKVIENFKQSVYYKNTENKGIWLETKTENLAAQALYKKVGFTQIRSDINNTFLILNNS